MYRFWGKVKKGQGRGKGFGFPTANINLHKKIPEGVYLSLTTVSRKQYNSLTFIGNAKTFNESIYQAESFLLDFQGSLYNKFITIKLLKKVRGNIKFKSVKSLILQMKKDEKIARKYFSKSPNY